jgi:hypothetical protein
MDEDPSNEVFVLSLLEGYGADEAEAMAEAEALETEPAPCVEDWQSKYLTLMDQGELPPDRSKARHIARMAKSITIVDGELYKHAAFGVLQRCIPIPQGREFIRDIHAGVCGHHAAPRTLMGTHSAKAFTGPLQSPMPTRLYVPMRVPVLRPQD